MREVYWYFPTNRITGEKLTTRGGHPFRDIGAARAEITRTIRDVAPLAELNPSRYGAMADLHNWYIEEAKMRQVGISTYGPTSED